MNNLLCVNCIFIKLRSIKWMSEKFYIIFYEKNDFYVLVMFGLGWFFVGCFIRTGDFFCFGVRFRWLKF